MDRPREACIKYLMEDNKSFNIEARLCSAVQCTQYQARVGLSPNKVLGWGCLGPGIERAGSASTRTTSCAQMRCDGNRVCRGRQCACEGSELREPPPRHLLRQSRQLFQKALLGSVHRHSNNNVVVCEVDTAPTERNGLTLLSRGAGIRHGLKVYVLRNRASLVYEYTP